MPFTAFMPLQPSTPIGLNGLSGLYTTKRAHIAMMRALYSFNYGYTSSITSTTISLVVFTSPSSMPNVRVFILPSQ